MLHDMNPLVSVHNSLSTDAVLWRYMDFTKFVSLLENQSLFFVRADKLGDPFEGSFPKINTATRFKHTPDLSEEDIVKYGFAMQQLRRFTLITCWHESIHESEAMWKLYASANGGIAIKSNLQDFVSSFKTNEQIHIGGVQYVDYDNDLIPEDDLLSPYLHKRNSFIHENEVRAIIQKSPFGSTLSELIDSIQNLSSGELLELVDICETGIKFDVDLKFLIQEIIVTHFAPEWLLDLVNEVTKRYGLNIPVNRSHLAESPTW